jgi:UDP-N-acetylglucosamine diphosphorylase/glucosamine-1-phosphate N-acetyltransferase
MDHLTVVILAGGEGKRMQSNLPKVLHLIKNRPMLVRVIETAKLLNPHKIIVVTGKYDSLIKTTLSKYMQLNSITFSNQAEPLGTADAIKSCLPDIIDDGPVLILNGDMPLITEEILRRIVDTQVDALVVTAKFDNPTGYGRIICDSRGFIQKIVEEKDCTDAERTINIINTGIYYIHSMLLKEFIYKIDNDNAQQEYYLTDIIKLLKSRMIPVRTILLNTNENIYVSGVNTPEELSALEAYVS